MNKRVTRCLALCVALVMTLSATALAAAPSMGLYLGGNVMKYYTLTEYVEGFQTILPEMNEAGLANVAGVNQNGKILVGSEAEGGFREVKDTDLQGTYKDSEGNDVVPNPHEPSDELEVVSVSAITQTIAKNIATDLKFLVNGTEELTKAEFDEKYGEEGYTVTFKYNRTDADLKATGEVNTDKDFKYAVQVKDAEGTLIPEELGLEDYLEVKVVDATKAVSIETVKIKGSDLDYVTVGEKDLEFEVTSAKNALGEELDEDSLNTLNGALQKIVSDNVDVAYPTSPTKFTARAAGNVTFTLTYYTEDDAIEVEVPVEVKEAGVATRVEAEDQKVAINTALTDLDFKVFDQHDLDITSTDKYSVVVKDEGVTDLSAKGTYTIEIQDEDDKVIGTFKVTVVDVEEADFDEFFFEENDEDVELEVNADSNKEVSEKTFTLKGIKDGVTVTADKLTIVDEGDGYYLKSSDKDVFTVNYTAGTVTVTLAEGLDKAATAKVQLINKMGSIEIVEAEVELEVVNTTPQIDKLTLGEEDKVVVGDTEEATLKAALKVLLTAGKDKEDEEIFDYDDMVEDITFIPGNNIVEVKIYDIYGGKVFRFDVEEVDGTVVRTQEQLVAALENTNVETIILGADIEIEDTLTIGRKITLNGNNKYIRGKIIIDADDVTIDDVTIDGGGNESTVKINGKNAKITNSTLKNAGKSTWDAVIDIRSSGDVTVEGCDISEGFRAILVYDAKKVMVDNCLLDGVYPINVNSKNENIELIVSNSTLNGWTSYGEIKSATFTNVNFGKETLYNQYAFIRPYADTTFTNCNFSNEIEFGSGVGGLTVDFNNCKINDVELTEVMLKEKLKELEKIKSGTWKINNVEISVVLEETTE